MSCLFVGEAQKSNGLEQHAGSPAATKPKVWCLAIKQHRKLRKKTCAIVQHQPKILLNPLTFVIRTTMRICACCVCYKLFLYAKKIDDFSIFSILAFIIKGTNLKKDG